MKSFRAYFVECDRCGSRMHIGSVHNARDTASVARAFQAECALRDGWRKRNRLWFCRCCPCEAKATTKEDAPQ